MHTLIPQESSIDAIHELIGTNANRIARELGGADQPTNTRDKYMYDEQQGPDEFFAPYLWRVVVQTSGIKWVTERILLFN